MFSSLQSDLHPHLIDFEISPLHILAHSALTPASKNSRLLLETGEWVALGLSILVGAMIGYRASQWIAANVQRAPSSSEPNALSTDGSGDGRLELSKEAVAVRRWFESLRAPQSTASTTSSLADQNNLVGIVADEVYRANFTPFPPAPDSSWFVRCLDALWSFCCCGWSLLAMRFAWARCCSSCRLEESAEPASTPKLNLPPNVELTLTPSPLFHSSVSSHSSAFQSTAPAVASSVAIDFDAARWAAAYPFSARWLFAHEQMLSGAHAPLPRHGLDERRSLQLLLQLFWSDCEASFNLFYADLDCPRNHQIVGNIDLFMQQTFPHDSNEFRLLCIQVRFRSFLHCVHNVCFCLLISFFEDDFRCACIDRSFHITPMNRSVTCSPSPTRHAPAHCRPRFTSHPSPRCARASCAAIPASAAIIRIWAGRALATPSTAWRSNPSRPFNAS
jgi:hypothetical protein